MKITYNPKTHYLTITAKKPKQQRKLTKLSEQLYKDCRRQGGRRHNGRQEVLHLPLE